MAEITLRKRLASTALGAALALVALPPGAAVAETGAAPSAGGSAAATGIFQRSFGKDAGSRILERSSRDPGPRQATSGDSARRRRETEPLDEIRLGRTERYQNLIDDYSQLNGLEPALVKAIIYAESGGDIRALSPAGAAGLMQLMPATARHFGATDRYDPEQSIATGTRYLRSLLDEFGSPKLALWAYNAGPGAVRAGRMPLETQRYVPRVLRLRRVLSSRSNVGDNS